MIFKILSDIADTPKRTEKESIINSHKDNDTLKRVFKLAYDPLIRFNIKKFERRLDETPTCELMSLENALDIIEQKLVVDKLRGHQAIALVEDLMRQLNPENADVLHRVILKDLRVGCTSGTANKIWKGLVREQPQMLASSNNDDLIDAIFAKGKAIAELKADGARCFAHVDASNDVTMTSRNGKPYHGLLKIEKALKMLNIQDFVIDGELVYAPNGIDDVSSRSTGNGIVNKSSNDTISLKEQDGIVFQVWDIIPASVYFGESNDLNMKYSERKKVLADLCKAVRGILEPIPWQYVENRDEASDVYNRYIDQGLEGIILKDPEALWENKRSKSIVKYKEVHESDLEIIEILEGDKKNKGKVGAFVLSSKCGKLVTKVGSGFSDAQRQEFWDKRDELIGQIVEFKYNAISKAQNKDTWSCFLPIFVQLRPDKDEPYCIEDMSGYKE